jgi:hydroxymethylglutaryl-CoA reductase
MSHERTSRLPAFYRLSLADRRELLRRHAELGDSDLARLDAGGLDLATADHMIENVIGTYALPIGVALNFRVNGRDVLVPMAIEEPSVVAAASNAARMIRAGGGFTADHDPPIMIAQVQLVDVADPAGAARRITAAEPQLLARARATLPRLCDRGGGPCGVDARVLSLPDERDGGMVVVHLHVDCRDAMGANLVNTLAETVAPELAALAGLGARAALRILSNLADRRLVRVEARVPLGALVPTPARPGVAATTDTPAAGGASAAPAPKLGAQERALADAAHRDRAPETLDATGAEVGAAIAAASRFAELDPYRAATHNKGIMNGVDAVLVATGNDWRGIEAGAHAYAARTGRYSPLATWRVEADALCGRLAMPMAVGVVGGALHAHQGARCALALLGVRSAADLAQVVGAAGLASNLAALRALATEGIQRGHMALHARGVARAAGAEDGLIDHVAAELAASGDVKVENARAILARVRASHLPRRS